MHDILNCIYIYLYICCSYYKWDEIIVGISLLSEGEDCDYCAVSWMDNRCWSGQKPQDVRRDKPSAKSHVRTNKLITRTTRSVPCHPMSDGDTRRLSL